MSEFTTALVVSPLSDGKSWVILQEFKYHVGAESSNDIIAVSKGFVTDFASVPRLFWLVIPKWGKYGNAAVIHDWLYWEQSDKRDRKSADLIFLEAMVVLKVSRWKRKVIYDAVRLFGWIAWNRNQIDKVNCIKRVIDTKEIKATMSSKRPGTIESAYKYYMNKKQTEGNSVDADNGGK